MINEALGFAEWLRLNEEVDPKVEVYTEFRATEGNKNPKLRFSYKRVVPLFQGMMTSLKPRLDRIIKRYLPDFGIEHTGKNQYDLNYVVTNSDFKGDDGEDLQLDFNSINPTNISTDGLEFFSAISSISKKEIASGVDFVEVMLNPEFKTVPAERLEDAILERLKTMWLGKIDPNEFSSDLSSIVFSKSIGGSFFNESELKQFLTNVALYAFIEIYIETLSEEFIVKREEIDIVTLNSELDDSFKRFVQKITTNSLSDDDAIELIAFIKRLTFKLRTKSPEIKKKSETIIADLMTEINKAGLTRKLMDAL